MIDEECENFNSVLVENECDPINGVFCKECEVNRAQKRLDGSTEETKSKKMNDGV